MKDCTKVCKPDKIDIFMSAVIVRPNLSVEKLVLSPEAEIEEIENADLVRSQKDDDVIGRVYEAVLQGWKELPHGSKLRKMANSSQIVLPGRYHHIVYAELHENMANLCVEKVIAKQITGYYIQKKCRCVINKKPNIQERAPLLPIEASHPFEMVAIDFCHLDKAKGVFKYSIIVCDHFTRFIQAYATKSKSSKAAATKLFHEFILQYGFPERIHHDRGPEFNCDRFKELHRLSDMKASNTTPWEMGRWKD